MLFFVWGEGEGVLLFCCFGKFQIYIPYLASLCDLVGMIKWPFQRLSDLQLGGKKVNLNSLVVCRISLLRYIGGLSQIPVSNMWTMTSQGRREKPGSRVECSPALFSCSLVTWGFFFAFFGDPLKSTLKLQTGSFVERIRFRGAQQSVDP